MSEFSTRHRSVFYPKVEHTITLRNVALHGDSVTFGLRHSKSSSPSDGQLVYLHATGRSVFLFTTVKKYFPHRYSFRHSTRPSFLLSNGDNLTVGQFFHQLRLLLHSYPDAARLSSHSFRIGGAILAAENGISPDLIRVAGRWKSNAYLGYIRSNESRRKIILYPN